jgi:alginate O-acetyltransferase complex protein AlgJ
MGGDFTALCREKADVAEKASAMSVRGREGWLFLAAELRHLAAGEFWGPAATKVSRATRPEHADPLPAILDFHAQMRKSGIELLVVPVPAKAAIYADKLDASLSPRPRLDGVQQRFFKELAGAGVEVLDLSEEFLDQCDQPMYCKTDSHWSGRACELAAKRIAKRIEGRRWLKDVPRIEVKTETREKAFEGDLVRGLEGDAPARESLPLRLVTAGGEPVEPSRASPILLLGDSHCLVFHAGEDMLASAAGLPDQLAAELGFAVDLVAVRGSGATPARVNLLRLARADAGYLDKKKLVIWCFSVREFTESTGWSKVPVVKP